MSANLYIYSLWCKQIQVFLRNPLLDLKENISLDCMCRKMKVLQHVILFHALECDKTSKLEIVKVEKTLMMYCTIYQSC